MTKRLPSTVQLPNGGGTEGVTLAFTMMSRSPEFMAPEFVLRTGYDKGVGLGPPGSCTVFEMYAGRNSFDFDGDWKQNVQGCVFDWYGP